MGDYQHEAAEGADSPWALGGPMDAAVLHWLCAGHYGESISLLVVV